MARTGSLDPLTRYRYTVYIRVDNNDNSFQKMGFQSVTSPRIDFQQEMYIEGGRHLNPRINTTGATMSPVTMRRGKSYSADFYVWAASVFKAFYGDKLKNKSNYRATIVIDHHDRRGRIIKKYVLVNCVPQAYIPASTFDSGDDTEVSIETLIFNYEGYREYSLNYNNLTAALGEVGQAAADLISGNKTPATLEPGFTGI